MSISTAVIACFAAFCLQIFLMGLVTGSKEMHSLQQRLLSNYSVHVRPVLKEEDQLEVNVTMHLFNILGLELKSQTLRSSGYIDVVWRDEYLSWEPEEFANITEILIPQTLVWLPDIVLANDVHGAKYFGDDRTLVQVRHDGTVAWQPDFLTETNCKVDIYKYPFDRQECKVSVMPWMTTSLYVTMTYPPLVTATTVINGEFFLLATRTERKELNVTYSQALLVQGDFVVVLQRRYVFHLLSTVLPLAAFSLLSPLALLVPADSGEKITLSVTVLLANLVFMGTLSDSMPRVADSISIFVLYASLQIMLSFTAVIVNVAALCLSRLPAGNDEEERDKPDNSQSKTSGLPVNDSFLKIILRSFNLIGKDISPRHRLDVNQQKVATINQQKVATIQEPGEKLEFSNVAQYDGPRATQPSQQQTAQKAAMDKSSPIGRRDKLWFMILFLIVICVDVTVFIILAV